MEHATHHRLVATELHENKKEVFRYLGYSVKDLCSSNFYETVDKQTLNLVDSCIKEISSALKPQAVYNIYDLKIENEKISFADICFESTSLSKNLSGCTKIALLAATIGPQVDFLIKKATKIDMTKAAVMQVTGAMFIEEYVNLVNEEISALAKKEGFSVRPRFSPGYGDVPLSIQRDFFRLLPCTQRLGLTLMDSLIMSPEKSVTAFVGLKRN